MTEIIQISDARERQAAILREHSEVDKAIRLLEECAVDRLAALFNAGEDVKVPITEQWYRCPAHGCGSRKPGNCGRCGTDMVPFTRETYAMFSELVGDLREMPAQDQARFLVSVAFGKVKLDVTCDECLNRNSRCVCEDRS